MFNPFSLNVSSLNPHKTLENLRFSNAFRLGERGAGIEMKHWLKMG